MNLDEYNFCAKEYADGVYRFVVKSYLKRTDAQDVVQYSFEKLWKHREGINFKAAKSYLFTTARNASIDFIRKNKRMSYKEALPDHRALLPKEDLDLSEILQEAFGKLKEEQRSVILLRDHEGFNYQEIAQMTGQSLSQVKTNIFRGRKILQNLLSKVYKDYGYSY
jgi:RNA polymerase sigma-70 factor (ECF subfamily)